MNLQELKNKGVTHLKVTDGFAVAVNPYDIQEEPNLWTDVENLPSLECPSIRNGEYEIGKVEEKEQTFNHITRTWDYVTFYDLPDTETRQVLVLKEQVEDELPPNCELCGWPMPDCDCMPDKEQVEETDHKGQSITYWGGLAKEEQVEDIRHIGKEVQSAISDAVRNYQISERVKPDTPICCSCGGRTALIKGNLTYRPDSEPYINGEQEDALIESGEIWVGAYKCDDCEEVQGFWTE